MNVSGNLNRLTATYSNRPTAALRQSERPANGPCCAAEAIPVGIDRLSNRRSLGIASLPGRSAERTALEQGLLRPRRSLFESTAPATVGAASHEPRNRFAAGHGRPSQQQPLEYPRSGHPGLRRHRSLDPARIGVPSRSRTPPSSTTGATINRSLHGSLVGSKLASAVIRRIVCRTE